MDRFVALAIINGRKRQDGRFIITPEERRRPQIIALGVSCRVISPRQLEETALALRIRHFIDRNINPSYIRNAYSPDHRLKSYRSKIESGSSQLLAQFEGQNDYKYAPLPSERHFRVLQLLPGEKKTPVMCKLVTHSLEEPLDFVALSYTWGKPSNVHKISCNGLTLLVAKNLRNALEELRSPTKALTVWIDAICINQDHETEKSVQVGLMGDIYRKSTQVYVWLGPASPDSKQGILLLQKISAAAHEFKGDPMVYEDLRRAGISPPGHEDWAALEALYWREWWTRIWVVQEICLPSKALFICGSASVDASDFFRATSFINNSAIQTTNGIETGSAIFFGKLRQEYLRGDESSLFSLLINTRSFQATNYCDKIYGLLGLCSPLDRKAIFPNYQKPYKETYHALAIHFLQEGSLDILTAVCDPFWREYTSPIPSWVPDWSIPPRCTSFLHPSTPISASASRSSHPSVQFSRSGNRLLAQGTLFDIVAHTYKPYLFQSMHERRARDDKMVKLLPEEWVSELGGETLFRMGIRLLCWEQAARKLKEYHTGENPFVAFLKTVTAGKMNGEENLEEMYTSFCRVNMFIPLGARDLEEGDYIRNGVFGRSFYRAAWGRTLFVTKRGYLGIGPYTTRAGDQVVILEGGKTPFVVRKGKNDSHVLVGESYVHGIMHGEAFGEGVKFETFCID